jgi:hypothetical protein
MSTVSLVGIVFLLGAVGAPEANPPSQVQPIATRHKAFAIPFSVTTDATLGPSAGEVRLYVSGDGGRRWTLYQRQQASAGKFYFRAGQDGEYWFAVLTGGLTEDRLYVGTPEPQLRVIVDTLQPQLELMATVAPEGQITTRWLISDDNLQPSTLTLDYKDSVDVDWHPIHFQPASHEQGSDQLVGQATWWPNVEDRFMSIRATVRDRADNHTTVTRHVELPQVAGGPGAVPTAQSTQAAAQDLASHSNGPGAVRWPAERSEKPARDPSENTQGWKPSPLARRASEVQPSSPPSLARTGAPGPSSDWQVPNHRSEPNASFEGSTLRARTIGQVQSGVPPAVDNDVVRGPEWAGPTGDVITSPSRRFYLNYEIDQSNPDQLGRVQLWYTMDGGHQWHRYGEDQDKSSPFLVEVDQEGTYGFRLVLESRDGLAARPPGAGDLADMWVHVDWTAPVARLTSARYGTGVELGQLLIQWDVSDRLLHERPVSLSYSDEPNGPWRAIVAGLANKGQYAWHVPEDVPRRFFLRLEARDQAGNVAIDQLAEPISADGLAPQGRIRGILPIDDDDPEGRNDVAQFWNSSSRMTNDEVPNDERNPNDE